MRDGMRVRDRMRVRDGMRDGMTVRMMIEA